MEFNQMESTDLQDPRGRENKEEIRIIEALAKSTSSHSERGHKCLL